MKKTAYFTFVLFSLLLAACQPGLKNGCTGLLGCSVMDPTGEKMKERHIQQCTDLGFEPGTESFANCRLQLLQNRNEGNKTLTCHPNYAGGMDCE